MAIWQAGRRLTAVLAMVLLAGGLGRPIRADDEEARRRAHAPRVTVEVRRRCFPAGKPASVHVSLYNLRSARLAAYRVDLEQLAPDAKAMSESDPKREDSLPYRLKRLDLSRLRRARSWSVGLKKTYSDRWMEKEVKVPPLSSGVYVIAATGGGVEDRTWLAVSSRAMLTKRSPDKVLVWVVESKTGKPLDGVPVAMYNAEGRKAAGETEKDGLARFVAPPCGEPCYVATRSGPPAFCLATSPQKEKPHRIYVYTDRPIYRPGHVVRFRGTMRAVSRGRLDMPENVRSAEVKIRSSAGGAVYQQELEVNEWGTFAGEFALAPEPPLGKYEIITTVGAGDDQTIDYTNFEVEAYRKPEFEVKIDIPREHYLGGETVPVTISADYYFGSPVAGGKLTYEVSFDGHGDAIESGVLTAAGLGTAAVAEVEPGFSGEAELDRDGKFLLEIPTRYVPQDRMLRVQATVRELALRPQEASASTLITAAKFRLSLSTKDEPYLVGDEARIEVRARDYDDEPVSTRVKLTLIERMRDREGRSYEKKAEREVETDAEGEAEVTYALERPGRYTVKAWVLDDEGNPTAAQTSFRVREEPPEKVWPALALSADKDEYQDGDVAEVHVETNLIGAWILVTVECEFLFDAVVHRVLANEFDLKIPIKEAHKPGVRVFVTAVREGETTRDSVGLNVPHGDRRMEVIIAPDREGYEPGQEARYALTTRDVGGRGVQAELGLGVVDESLYAIREDHTPPPFDVFWDARVNRVNTDFSFQRLYPGGGYQVTRARGRVVGALEEMIGKDAEAPAAHMPENALIARAGEEIRIRQRFLDTAFWAASVLTGPDGRGEVKFEMPDNLTTWRATARGLSRESLAGEAKQDVTVTMPLLVRLTLPRFYVEGDEGTAAAIVHNYTGEKRAVKVALTAEGAEVLGEAQQTVELEAEGIRKLKWTVKPTGPDRARFLVSADGGPGASDAMESTLPVVANGVKNVDAWAGVSDETAMLTVPLPAEAVAGSARLEVGLSPSLAGAIFEALEYLTSYPYGCAEQTMDSFLPDVIVARTLKRLGVDRPKPKLLDRYVSFGLQKLQRYQHDDGGWHWWEHDESDPYISAYIVYGLKIADEAGYVGAHTAMVKGTGYLREALAQEEYREAQAYLLWALAFADQWDDESLLKALDVASDLFEQREKLNLFSRGSLARAVECLSRQPAVDGARGERLARAARTLAQELEAGAVESGIGSYWSAESRERYSWLDNDVEVTAQVLSALLAIKPDSDRIAPAVRWLMAARRGKAWSSTKDTAAAVLALAAYLERRPEELAPDYTLRVVMNDETARELPMTQESIFADPQTVIIEADKLMPGDNALRLEKTGTGSVYWSARLHYLVPPEKALPLAKGISVKRTYRVSAASPLEAGEQITGDIVQVTLRLSADRNLRYALLEEPIPAGCEVVAGEDRPWESPWDRREVWDSRIVFFFDYLPRSGRTIEYVLRTEAPGQYNILPTVASLMYFPEVRGREKLVRMRVIEEQ